MVTIGGNPLAGRTDLEPTLDTLMYDTGLMKLEQADWCSICCRQYWYFSR